jgi:transketolase
MNKNNGIRKKMADTLRFLSLDMIERAKSGHPGAALGLSDIAVVLSEHLKHNPKNPKWLNRDRVVFSGGHISALIYSLLYLWGYDLSLDDLKNFRQLDSKTPGHPEKNHTPGIEVTTGPLGQGIANSVGMAMASKYLAYLLNRENAQIIQHYIYCFCGDGDLQEGISYEACALAGKFELDNLILIYDSNKITIEGDSSIAWNEDIEKRFIAQNWDVIKIDGHNYNEIDKAIKWAKNRKKPAIIIANTTIAKGSCKFEGSAASHGAPLGKEEIMCAKKKAGFDPQKEFFVDDDVLIRFRCAIEKGDLEERKWKKLILEAPYKEQNDILERVLNPSYKEIKWPHFEKGKKIATRETNGIILNAIAKAIVSFVGGSADLSPSNKSYLENMGDFPEGKNFHFGIREHAMAAITNGMAAYGAIIPFSSTFFVFSDYQKPAIRIAALSKLKNYFVWTHDSIGVGEDGPTHQPIEQLSAFRALPDFYLFRPADGNENIACWKIALKIDSPCGFVLSRQKLPILENVSFEGVSKGGYLIKASPSPKVIIASSGSEVSLALDVAKELEKENIEANVVSMPCMELFLKQEKSYKNLVFPKNVLKVAIEAGTAIEWYRFADEIIAIEQFGASAKANDVFKKFGFSTYDIKEKIIKLLKQI